MFEEEEREFLSRPPLQAFCPLVISVLVVDRGHCVRTSGDGHRYSTPPEYSGKRVSVTITDDKIYIYDLNSWGKFAEHKRCKNKQGNKNHLLPEDLPGMPQIALQPAYVLLFNEMRDKSTDWIREIAASTKKMHSEQPRFANCRH